MTDPLYLVITRAGTQSLHPHWLTPDEARNFDILVAFYSEPKELEKRPGVRYIYVPGKKVEGWNKILADHKDFIEKYEAIALIDDDILCSAEEISHCFAVGREYNLSIWQPSLSWDSYITRGGTLHHPSFALRFVNQIEMMCPFFSIEALSYVSQTFSLGWESGIDLVWTSLLPENLRRYAIVDMVQVQHTRPVGKEKALNGFIGRSYEDDIYACLNFFDMEWPSLIVEFAVLRNGKIVKKFVMASHIARIVKAINVGPPQRVWRPILDYFRHQVTRKICYSNKTSSILSEYCNINENRCFKAISSEE